MTVLEKQFSSLFIRERQGHIEKYKHTSWQQQHQERKRNDEEENKAAIEFSPSRIIIYDKYGRGADVLYQINHESL